MPRLQIYIRSDLYPVGPRQELTADQAIVFDFLTALPGKVADVFGPDAEKVRSFRHPHDPPDKTPVDIDITGTYKVEPAQGIDAVNTELTHWAQEQLSEHNITVGVQLAQLAVDTWARTDQL